MECELLRKVLARESFPQVGKCLLLNVRRDGGCFCCSDSTLRYLALRIELIGSRTNSAHLGPFFRAHYVQGIAKLAALKDIGFVPCNCCLEDGDKKDECVVRIFSRTMH